MDEDVCPYRRACQHYEPKCDAHEDVWCDCWMYRALEGIISKAFKSRIQKMTFRDGQCGWRLD